MIKFVGFLYYARFWDNSLVNYSVILEGYICPKAALFMIYVIIIGVFQSFIGLLLFLDNRKKKSAYDLLMWILICIGAHLSIKFIIYVLIQYHELQKEFTTFLNLTYGPLLYLYTRKLTNAEVPLNRRWLHLLPAWTGGIFYVYIAIDICVQKRLPVDILNIYNHTLRSTVYFSWVIYSVFSLLQMRKLDKTNFVKEKRLIKFIAYSLCFLSAMLLGVLITARFGNIPNSELYIKHIRTAGYAILFLIAFSIPVYYYKVRTSNAIVFSDIPAPPQLQIEEDNNTKDNKRNIVLGEVQQTQIIRKLTTLMEDKKIYLDMDLTLDKLAGESGTSRHHISESLNNYLQKSFYTFVNEYRIGWITKHLDKCLQNDTVPNMLTLAYEAGFKSKSSFNQYFKKIHGCTPSEYMKVKAHA
ncbi:MAG: helix-turn-helix domain-containing protein [Arachidicoccus sp.]|nr:helix-turn-helix domain-containing protein [Arachidicoccus sp.]